MFGRRKEYSLNDTVHLFDDESWKGYVVGLPVYEQDLDELVDKTYHHCIDSRVAEKLSEGFEAGRYITVSALPDEILVGADNVLFHFIAGFNDSGDLVINYLGAEPV